MYDWTELNCGWTGYSSDWVNAGWVRCHWCVYGFTCTARGALSSQFLCCCFVFCVVAYWQVSLCLLPVQCPHYTQWYSGNVFTVTGATFSDSRQMFLLSTPFHSSSIRQNERTASFVWVWVCQCYYAVHCDSSKAKGPMSFSRPALVAVCRALGLTIVPLLVHSWSRLSNFTDFAYSPANYTYITVGTRGVQSFFKTGK